MYGKEAVFGLMTSEPIHHDVCGHDNDDDEEEEEEDNGDGNNDNESSNTAG